MTEKGSPARLHAGREIPHRAIADISNLPNDYSTTPGGSIFSTTPGGSRIFYERNFLMQCRNSPLAKTPPRNMANIPGITCPGDVDIPKENGVVEGAKGQNHRKLKELRSIHNLRWTSNSQYRLPFTLDVGFSPHGNPEIIHVTLLQIDVTKV